MEECHNHKSNIFCCFVYFRKAFDTVPRNNLWNRLEEINVPFELRAAAIRLYRNVIPKLNIFCIYIDNLEVCLEEAGCVGTILTGIVIILLLYAEDFVLLARCPSDLDK